MISGIKRIFFNLNEKPLKNNIILTGIPRSGSTLACKLLCDFEDVIALNEPLEAKHFRSTKKALKHIEWKFFSFRKTLLKNGKAIARTKKGSIADNAYSKDPGDERKLVLKRSPVHFSKDLTDDFTLVLKHCAEFTLILPELTKSYPCFAMIRNPLSVLGSWNSVNVPVSRGKVAKSKWLKPELFLKLEQLDELWEKQLHILSWYFQQFKFLPENKIIKYEKLIESKGKALVNISQRELGPHLELKNMNKNALYNRDKITFLADKLLSSEGAYWDFYEKSQVQDLLKLYLNE